MWVPIKDSPNYVSDCGKFTAIYKFTARSGYANYWIFFATEKKLIGKNAIGMGGLPTRQALSRF